jgi:RimJ/RimL family protein N-acetyltransferase
LSAIQTTLSRVPETIATQRLILRRWLVTDLDPFASMNADSRVMEFFPSRLSRLESDALASRIQKHFDERGFGLWAVEIRDVAQFAGFIGLSTPRFDAHFTPCVEIGWRIAAEYWGCGYATEGALSVVRFAFQSLGLHEVVSMTTEMNLKSRRVMEKIGMSHAASDDFDHPLVPSGHRLARHVLYRLKRTIV